MTRIYALLLIACLSFSSLTADARKIPRSLYGHISLTSGDSIIAEDTIRVSIPQKKKKLEIIANAYTHKSKIERVIDPDSVRAATIWTPSAPERPHTFVFLKEYGWCQEVEHSPYITLYCYASKGFHISGNGGIWIRGKGKMLVLKGGKIYDFGQPDKKLDKKLLAKFESLVADDPDYAAYLRTARGRRDKILRSLVMYNPKNL